MEREPQQLGLRLLGGLREARLAPAVIVRRDALDGRVRAAEPLRVALLRRAPGGEHDDRGAVCGDGAGGVGAKGSADAVGGPDHPLGIRDRLVGREGGAAADCNLAESEPERVDAACDRHESRGARGLHELGGAVDAELVGEHGCEVVLVVPNLELPVLDGATRSPLVEIDPGDRVRQPSTAHEDARACREAARCKACIAERLVRQPEQDALLDAHLGSRRRRQAPEREVEALLIDDALACGRRAAARVAAAPLMHERRQQIGGGLQALPERSHRAGAGEAHRHPRHMHRRARRPRRHERRQRRQRDARQQRDAAIRRAVAHRRAIVLRAGVLHTSIR